MACFIDPLCLPRILHLPNNAENDGHENAGHVSGV